MPTHGGLSFTLGDRASEITNTVGTGPYELNGISAPGRLTFVQSVGNGQRTFYTAEAGAQFEEGLGTVTAGTPAQISRDLIIRSSNNNLAVNWGAGPKTIFCDSFAALLNQVFARPGGGLPLGAVETRGPFTPSAGSPNVDVGSIASTARIINIGWSNILINSILGLGLQLGDSGGFELTGYATMAAGQDTGGALIGTGDADEWLMAIGSGLSPVTHYGNAVMTAIHSANFWTYQAVGVCSSSGPNFLAYASGAKAMSPGPLTQLRFRVHGAAANFAGSGTVGVQIIHAV